MDEAPNLTHIAEGLRFLALPVVELHEDQANARAHDERNLASIEASLTRFGQRQPLIVQKQGMIVRAGNGRLTVARKLGWTHVAALVVDESAVEATAYAIADNRTAELASWDERALAGVLASLPGLDGTGFSGDDLAALLSKLNPEPPEQFPEVDVEPEHQCPKCGYQWSGGGPS